MKRNHITEPETDKYALFYHNDNIYLQFKMWTMKGLWLYHNDRIKFIHNSMVEEYPIINLN